MKRLKFGQPSPQPASSKAGARAELLLMLLTLTILAILAGLPKHWSRRTIDIGIGRTVADIGSFKTALGMYKDDTGDYPTSLDGLRALMVKPSGALNWKGPYLDKDTNYSFLDKWNRPYVYQIPGRHNPTSYDLYSLGPNGTGGSETIGNWTDTTTRQQ